MRIVGLIWLAALIAVVPLEFWLVARPRRATRADESAYRSRRLQDFGDWIAAAPGDGSIEDTLTLHWCPLCRVCTWGCSHWVQCGAWRDQQPVVTVTSHEVIWRDQAVTP